MSRNTTPVGHASNGSLHASPIPTRRRSPRFLHTTPSPLQSVVPKPSQATLAAQNGTQLPSAAPQPPPQPHDSLFRFTIDVLLKKTTGQRIDDAEKLGLHMITLNDWTSIKRRIWEICAP
ncbi:hypothetical protein Ae201684P_015553 [Aphanomyces euteiches]|nr:hypothetical protein Ae201684P_015553 [Aphanomyces euteiches]